MPDLKALKVLVYGKVQGVYFRASTRRYAVKLKLTGSVRNLPDGMSVEVHAEGEKTQLDGFVEYLKTGPPGARIDNIEIEWSEYTGSYIEFSIIY